MVHDDFIVARAAEQHIGAVGRADMLIADVCGLLICFSIASGLLKEEMWLNCLQEAGS